MSIYPKCNRKTTHTPKYWRILYNKKMGTIQLEDWTFRKHGVASAENVQTKHGRIVGFHKWVKKSGTCVWFVLCEINDKDTETKSHHWVNLSSRGYDNQKYFDDVNRLSLDHIMTQFNIPSLP